MAAFDSNHPLWPENIRLRLLDAGYPPVPVIGKKPTISGYPTYATTPPTERVVRGWSRTRRDSRNTGIVCGAIRVIDLDVDDECRARACHLIAERVVGQELPCRIGRWPRVALFARSDDPQRRYCRHSFPRGTVELLGAGRQVVVEGLHPDTSRPYQWPFDPLWELAADQLPILTQAQEDQIVLRLGRVLGGPARSANASCAQHVGSLPAAIPVGQRNDELWPKIKDATLSSATEDDLLQRATLLNATLCVPPLSESEIRAKVRWAWGKKLTGDIWPKGGEARAVLTASELQMTDPDSFYLLGRLRMAHGAEPGAIFSVSPIKMAPSLRIGSRRVYKALATLMQAGLLEQVSPARPMVAARFRLRR